MINLKDLRGRNMNFIQKLIAIKQYKKYGYFKYKGWKIVLIKD